MAEWVPVAKESDLVDRLGVEVEGRKIALFRVDGEVYALDDVCSHEYSLLSEGEIWDDAVYCPKHGSKFEIKSGAVRSLPATKPVASHPVKVEEGTIYVELSW
jgi:3-phenylpropionate/trans-cinnamate dioxygenase ferredoxin component